eukprot:scaffold68223_cov38-Phaeocystis_antarctica.AAC.2
MARSGSDGSRLGGRPSAAVAAARGRGAAVLGGRRAAATPARRRPRPALSARPPEAGAAQPLHRAQCTRDGGGCGRQR